MSLKKELLGELTEKQLKKLAENKGLKFSMSESQKKYYEDWNEKEKLVDMMNDKEDITIKEIEEFIRNTNSKN
jgi:signal recognition particle subunit SEC65